MTFDDPSNSFNRALRELDEIQQELAATPSTDFERRQTLREREAAIRLEIRSFGQDWTDHMSIDQLQRRIAAVERKIEDHYGNRLSHTSGAQTGFGGGLDPKALHAMNRAMDESGDLEGLRKELQRLRNRAATLEAD